MYSRAVFQLDVVQVYPADEVICRFLPDNDFVTLVRGPHSGGSV
jgi:hypothetical protein